MNRHVLTGLTLLTLAAALACTEPSKDIDSGTDTDSESGESTDTESTDTESTDTESTDTESTDTESTDSTDTGEPVSCPDMFPTFDKSCDADSDCALALHTINCCGTDVAWGIAVAEVAAFETAEAVCDSQYPECDCASLPTVAEDGNSAVDPSTLAVHCQMGECSSYVMP